MGILSIISGQQAVFGNADWVGWCESQGKEQSFVDQLWIWIDAKAVDFRHLDTTQVEEL